MKAKSKQSWEKEFDSADLKDWIFDDRKELSPDRVKSFIRTLLQKEREELLGEIESLNENCFHSNHPEKCGDCINYEECVLETLKKKLK